MSEYIVQVTCTRVFSVEAGTAAEAEAEAYDLFDRVNGGNWNTDYIEKRELENDRD